MKKQYFCAALISALILSGCGADSNKSSDELFSSPAVNTNAEMESGGFMDYDYALDASEEGYYPEPEESPAADNSSGSSAASTSSEASASLGADEINREMLVYSCTMSIDTLEFTSTVNGLKTLINQYGGFIEMENYDDGGSYGRWYSESEVKWQSYSATLRVPSRNYDVFCNSAGGLGDLRSKNASVQNLSSEYHDLATSLEIYEAKEERYIALLAGITEDEYAVAIERELTDLQIEIARIKSRMNKINTDVTYSYIYITINEVKEYISEPVKTDTFIDRLVNTLKNTGREFVGFLEAMLFLIIRLIPYLILIAVLIIVVILVAKKRRIRRAQLHQKAAAQGTQVMQSVPFSQAPQTMQAAQNAQTLQGAAQSNHPAPNTPAAQTAQNAQGAVQTPQGTAQTTQQAPNTPAAQTAQSTQPSGSTNESPSETE